MDAKLTTGIGQRQTQRMSRAQVLGIKLIEKSLPELRAEIVDEMSANPAIEDLDHDLETPLSEVEAQRKKDAASEVPDYPEENWHPDLSKDETAVERRQAFFDNQVHAETLQEHLLAQLPLSDIPQEDWPLVEVLVGDLNDDGFYKGSLPDVMMCFGKTEAEIDALLAQVRELDPVGCGARTPKECLLAQLDTLDGSPRRETVRRMLENHLEDIAGGRFAVVMANLGLTREEYVEALKELRTLNPHPGRAYPGERDRVEYVNPEVHAERREGRWIAETDKRSLPTIRISPSFEAMLKDPNQTAETKAYVRERIQRAVELQDAIRERQTTITNIAQEIFDRQPEFFEKGIAGLRPLTETEVAKKVGVDVSTVSRTVNDKYASTPKGTVELRRFFVSGVTNAAGETVAQTAVLEALKAIVAAENPHAPLADGKIAAMLAEKGFPIARRTVAKYRGKLNIPDVVSRTR